jgi:endoglucanase
MRDVAELLLDLVRIPGPSGFEDAVCIAIRSEVDNLGATEVDGLGNLVLRLPAPSGAPSLMLTAHMDQIGLIVKHIADDGFLYCERIGLVDERTLLASRIQVWTDDGPRLGVIGVRSRHLVSEAELGRAPQVGELWIDVGARSAEEVAALGIEIGRPATLCGEPAQLAGRMVVGASIDNRAGCAALVAVAGAAAERARDVELVFVWSTQEEVGSRGAKVAAGWIEPTIAVTVDTTPAGDPSTPVGQATAQVGRGPVIRALDNRGTDGTIYNVAVKRHLLGLAKERGIPHQIDVFPTWTDAFQVQLAGKGVPTGGVYIPRLCSHSPSEILDLSDLGRTVELLDGVAQTDASTVRELATRPAYPLALPAEETV